MRGISKIINIILVIAVLVSICAAVGSTITKKPFLLTMIRSNSMYPVWERGDLVMIKNLGKNEEVHKGDIIFFKPEKGGLASKGWIAHRITGGNLETGFITKGDANKFTDQESFTDTGSIKREWIAARAMVIGEKPIVIPKLGFLSLWAEKYQSHPLILPILAVILAIIIGIGELTTAPKKQKKQKGMELPFIYIIGGITISIIMGSTMLSSGQTVNVFYEVNKHEQGVLMGSDVGVLKVGDVVSRPLSQLNNGGFFPLVGGITTKDSQISLSHTNVYLSTGQQMDTEFTVTAQKPGKYASSIKIGLFYPLLPPKVIYFLAQKSYWLALICISLIPGLPLMIYPFLDRKVRGRTIKLLKKKKRKLLGY